MLNLIRDFKFGRPQLFATLLLLVFLAQSVWLALHVEPLEPEVQAYGAAMSPQINRNQPQQHSAAVLALLRGVGATQLLALSWELPGHFTLLAIRLPFLFFGWFLGASIWWVARRLYSNAGGYVALSLYVFSPLMLRASSIATADIVVAACVFGVVFTAIGIAHILHASPRKWIFRPLLLGVGAGVGAAALPSAAWAFVLGAVFALYLAEGVVARALLVLAATFVLAMAVSSAVAYSIGMTSVPMLAGLFSAELGRGLELLRLGDTKALYLQHLPIMILFVIAIAVLPTWKRARYFGNIAPLLAGIVLLPVVGIASFPFFLVFIAGIAADLIETSSARITVNGLAFLLAVQAVFSLATVYWRAQN
jgi:hypothetical protein